MRNVISQAWAVGLETCAQQTWCGIGSVVHQQLAIDAGEIILSGMAIGPPENRVVTEREPRDSFVHGHFG